MSRIGVIGLGTIGRAVAEYAANDPQHTLSFTRNRSSGDAGWRTRTGIEPELGAPTNEELQATDVVVEAAHPEVVELHGHRILQYCDLVVVSVGALARPALLASLTEQALRSRTRLVVPQGALVGLDGVLAQSWSRAVITMVKAPAHLDPPPAGITAATVLHDGPVGPLAARFPRNVNAMVAFALATLGLDRTIARLVCDPDTEFGRLDMDLSADDGGTLHISKAQPMVGVSGSEMTASILHTLRTVTGSARPGLQFG